jgi:hypothetical protein
VYQVPSNRIDWFLSRHCVASSFFPLFPRAKWAPGLNKLPCIFLLLTQRSCILKNWIVLIHILYPFSVGIAEKGNYKGERNNNR